MDGLPTLRAGRDHPASRPLQGRRTRLPEGDRCPSQAASALRENKKKYTHRDIKPDNIFVSETGALVLGDFGLVRDESADLSLTATGESNVGAWRFMPHVWREMARSLDYDYAFDLYALAKTLWCLAAGETYLPREAFADGEYNLAQRWPSNHGMEALYRIFPKILVDRREKVAYKSTSEMQADVDAIIGVLSAGVLDL